MSTTARDLTFRQLQTAMSKKYTVRKLFNDIHLWLGLSSGIILFIVCLSGTVYTFQKEIIQLVEPEKFKISVPDNGNRLATGALISQVEERLNGKVTTIEMSDNPAATFKVTVSAPSATNGEKKGAKNSGRGKAYYVDPYTGAVLGNDGGKTKEFFTTVMKLHRWLLIEGGTGRVIVGSATIIFVLLTLTGIILWFPAKIRYWKQGLRIKTDANWKRVNHDLHNTLGFYSFILLLIMGLTGLCWSFEWYRNGVSNVMGAEVFKGRGEKPLPSVASPLLSEAIGIDNVVSTAEIAFPYTGRLRISLPEEPEGSFVVSKHRFLCIVCVG